MPLIAFFTALSIRAVMENSAVPVGIAVPTGTVVEPPGMTAPVTASDDEVGYLPTTIAHASV